jgi:F-type H+-transporting ATPase subunit delta
MAESITIARPYAKALFETALHLHMLEKITPVLQTLAIAAEEDSLQRFIKNPKTSARDHVALLLSLVSVEPTSLQDLLQRFLTVLALNKRIVLLPSIQQVFTALLSEKEKTLEVKVRSFTALTESQEQKLAQALAMRFQKSVTLRVVIDKTLQGGAVIEAGDLVINGSISHQLQKLKTLLTA